MGDVQEGRRVQVEACQSVSESFCQSTLYDIQNCTHVVLIDFHSAHVRFCFSGFLLFFFAFQFSFRIFCFLISLFVNEVSFSHTLTCVVNVHHVMPPLN